VGNVQTIEVIKKMSEEEINMWSILITVLKNQGKEYGTVDNIASDIEITKEMIKNFG